MPWKMHSEVSEEVLDEPEAGSWLGERRICVSNKK
jgi:hypothetical protein